MMTFQEALKALAGQMDEVGIYSYEDTYYGVTARTIRYDGIERTEGRWQAKVRLHYWYEREQDAATQHANAINTVAAIENVGAFQIELVIGPNGNDGKRRDMMSFFLVYTGEPV